MDNLKLNLPASSCQWGDKTLISDTTHKVWLMIVLVGVLVTTSMSFSYMYDLGVTEKDKNILGCTALGIEIMLAFLAVHCMPKSIANFLKVSACTLLPLIAIFSIASFMISQQWANDNKGAKTTIAYADFVTSNLKNHSFTSAANEKAVLDRARDASYQASKITSTPQTAIYDYCAKALGINKQTFTVCFRLLWSLSLLIGVLAIEAWRQSKFTAQELNDYIQSFKAVKKIQVGLNSPTSTVQPYENLEKKKSPQRKSELGGDGTHPLN